MKLRNIIEDQTNLPSEVRSQLCEQLLSTRFITTHPQHLKISLADGTLPDLSKNGEINSQ